MFFRSVQKVSRVDTQIKALRRALQILKERGHAYHGTPVSNVGSIVREGKLLPPEKPAYWDPPGMPRVYFGDRLPVIGYSGPDWKATFAVPRDRVLNNVPNGAVDPGRAYRGVMPDAIYSHMLGGDRRGPGEAIDFSTTLWPVDVTGKDAYLIAASRPPGLRSRFIPSEVFYRMAMDRMFPGNRWRRM